MKKHESVFNKVFDTSSKAWRAYNLLIQSYYGRPRTTYYKHCHHIMPRCCYKWGLIKCDNMESPYNTCYVTEYEHALLHYLLYKCAKVEKVKVAMSWATTELTKSAKRKILYGTL